MMRFFLCIFGIKEELILGNVPFLPYLSYFCKKDGISTSCIRYAEAWRLMWNPTTILSEHIHIRMVTPDYFMTKAI